MGRDESAEARADRADKRMDRFDRSLGGIRKLLQHGMKMLAEVQRIQRETADSLRDLAASQKITERKLQASIDSLQKGGNGRRRS